MNNLFRWTADLDPMVVGGYNVTVWEDATSIPVTGRQVIAANDADLDQQVTRMMASYEQRWLALSEVDRQEVRRIGQERERYRDTSEQ